MPTRFARKLVHEIRSRVGEGLVIEFDEIEYARELGKIERQFEVLGAEMLANGPAFLRFVVKAEFVPGESKRVSLDIFFFSLRQAGDDSRVDAPAQEDSDRDIADQLASYRLREDLANRRFQLVVRRILNFWIEGDSPIAFNRK